MGNLEQVPSETFAIGEVAIYCRRGSLNFGAEATIMGPLKEWRVHDFDGSTRMVMGYHVDGLVAAARPDLPTIAEPQHLRKKRPPADGRAIVQWMDCPWQPEVLRV